MLVNILTFLSENKAIITGATLCVGEVVVIIVNLCRKGRIELDKMDDVRKSRKEVPQLTPWLEKTDLQKILWAANPLNLFKN